MVRRKVDTYSIVIATVIPVKATIKQMITICRTRELTEGFAMSVMVSRALRLNFARLPMISSAPVLNKSIR